MTISHEEYENIKSKSYKKDKDEIDIFIESMSEEQKLYWLKYYLSTTPRFSKD